MKLTFCCIYANANEIIILESSNSPLSKMVQTHMEFLVANHFEQASSADLQVIANALLASYNYTQADLKYDKMIAKVLMTLWMLKTKNDQSDELVQKLTYLIKKLNDAFVYRKETQNIWHVIMQYLDLDEQRNAAHIFEAIALERVKIVQEYLHNNSGLLMNSCAQTQEYNQKAAIRINSIASVFKAFEEMPFEGEEHERAFAILNSAYSLVLTLEAEQPKLIAAMNPIIQHVEDASLMNIALDSLYYAQFYYFLQSNYSNGEPVLLFDQKGLIPEQQRTKTLPVVYYNKDL